MAIKFFLYKLIKSLLVPPGCFSTVLALLGLSCLLKKHKGKALGGMLLILSLAFWFLATPIGERFILLPLEKAVTPSLPEAPQNPVIVLLDGGCRYGKTPEETEPGPYTVQRAVGAFLLAQKNQWPIIVTGSYGGGKYPISAAKAISILLKKLGFTGEIILEEEARTTWENMVNIKDIVTKRKFKEIILVTSAFHMKRASWCAMQNLEEAKLYHWPVGYLADEKPLDPLDFLAVTTAKNVLALREYIGLIAYKIIY